MITMQDIIREGHPTLAKVATEVSVPLSKDDVLLIVNHPKSQKNINFARA